MNKYRLGSVVLVGRPNVGKSTLFNRVTGRRRAIVTPIPGTTRDVLREEVEWQGVAFELVDTGGLFGASEDPLQREVADHGMAALDEATVVVLLVDGRDGVVPADVQVAERARRVGTPVILAVNKTDDHAARNRVPEFHTLGIEPVLPIAAEHGLGIGDLLDVIIRSLPGGVEAERKARLATAVDEIAVAIVGRPNVGKSSLVNLLARETRVLVSDLAGTTRDAIDTRVTVHGQVFRLVDTAGIRRPGRVASGGQVEAVSVTVARRALRRADVAVVVIDASAPIAKQDAAIVGEAEQAGCGIVIAANKWDLVPPGEPRFAAEFDADLRDALKFADYAPIVHLSALTGTRTSRLIQLVQEVAHARAAHIATAELNGFLERVTKQHRPPSRGGRETRIQYGTQIGTKPPRFLLFINTATKLHFSYERFLQNRFRETFGFVGTPIRLVVRARRPARRSRRR